MVSSSAGAPTCVHPVGTVASCSCTAAKVGRASKSDRLRAGMLCLVNMLCENESGDREEI